MSRNNRACANRLCVSCESKRANELAQDTAELFDYIWQLNPSARVLMLTLTSRNRPLDQTRAMLLDHQKALKAFWSYQRLTTATLGHFTNIEIDFEKKKGVITAHVHSHSLPVVEAGALSDQRYIRQAEYVALWQRALQVSYKPIVDIRAIKNRDGHSTDPVTIRGAVREVCKYCLDTHGFIEHENGHLRVEPKVAVAFALAVHRRRLTSMDRIFLAAKKLRAQTRTTPSEPHSGD
jgi:plasmid rolling circle replication initiator protein Rep